MKTLQRDQSLDFLKSISIIFVLIWHLQPFKLDASTLFGKFLSLVVYGLNSHIFCVAVPTFFTVALYLFIRKLSKLEFLERRSYFKGRIKKIFGIYLTYLVIQLGFFFVLSYASQQNLTVMNYLRFPGDLPVSQTSEVLWSLISGGPRLPLSLKSPLIPYSAFYFLADLLILTGLAFIYEGFSFSVKRRLFILVSIFTGGFFLVAPAIGQTIYGNRIENFLIYIPIASFWAYYPSKFLSYRKFYLIGFLLLCVLDQYLGPRNLRGELYSRISVVLGCLSFISYTVNVFYENSLQEVPKKIPNFLNLFAKYSLGIYAWHQYVMLILWVLVNSVYTYFKIPLNWIIFIDMGIFKIQLTSILFFISTVLVTIAVVQLIARTRFKYIVS
jgi:hypothetical protein